MKSVTFNISTKINTHPPICLISNRNTGRNYLHLLPKNDNIIIDNKDTMKN